MIGLDFDAAFTSPQRSRPPWPEYRLVGAGEVGSRMARRLVLDANGFLGETLGKHMDIEFPSAGGARMTRPLEGRIDLQALSCAVRGDTVFHLAANADVRFGQHPRKDLEQNTIADAWRRSLRPACPAHRLRRS